MYFLKALFPTSNTGYPRPATNYKPATPVYISRIFLTRILALLPTTVQYTPEATLAFQLKLLFLFLKLIS